MSSWEALAAELDAWRMVDLAPTLWWRDDDAEGLCPALERLNQLSLGYRVPLYLATIPQSVRPDLAALLASNPRLWLLQHGYSHRSHALPGQRKCELGDDRPLAETGRELAQGWQQLQRFRERALPVLVPPWNRLSEQVAERLPGLGYARLSVLGARPQRRGIAEVNVHVDLVNWKQGRCFAGEAAVIGQLVAHLRSRRVGGAEPQEPTGIMTHHLAHDEACWAFLAHLFTFLERYPEIRWLDGAALLDA